MEPKRERKEKEEMLRRGDTSEVPPLLSSLSLLSAQPFYTKEKKPTATVTTNLGSPGRRRMQKAKAKAPVAVVRQSVNVNSAGLRLAGWISAAKGVYRNYSGKSLRACTHTVRVRTHTRIRAVLMAVKCQYQLNVKMPMRNAMATINLPSPNPRRPISLPLSLQKLTTSSHVGTIFILPKFRGKDRYLAITVTRRHTWL